MSLDEYFATDPPHERPVFEAVVAHLDTVGPVYVEPVSVGILLKRRRTFAELRPMRHWVAMSFTLQRVVHHPLIVRKPILNHGGRFSHVANIASPCQLDAELADVVDRGLSRRPLTWETSADASTRCNPRRGLA
jgi:uncharacterized protein DUF5655